MRKRWQLQVQQRRKVRGCEDLGRTCICSIWRCPIFTCIFPWAAFELWDSEKQFAVVVLAHDGGLALELGHGCRGLRGRQLRPGFGFWPVCP